MGCQTWCDIYKIFGPVAQVINHIAAADKNDKTASTTIHHTVWGIRASEMHMLCSEQSGIVLCGGRSA